jgi:phosphate transport system substrate-binding protein
MTILGLATALLALVACGGAAAEPTATSAPMATDPPAATTAPVDEGMLPVDPMAVSGDIRTAGSSTVFPLSERLAARFRDEGFAGNITVDSIGTGAGFERFCVAGESDIANASRPINEEETASCQAIGREPIEFRVGTDALAVAVSPENDWATDVTLEQLALLFSTAVTWADVDPTWPAEPISRYVPGTDSGTLDYFVEEVLNDDREPLLNAANLQTNEDDSVLVQGVANSPYAIGFFGYAYYAANQDQLNVLMIEGVLPSEENVANTSYPLARPLFIYSTADIMSEKEQVAAFIAFYLNFVNEEIIDVGYFPATEADLAASVAAYQVALGE